MKGRHERSGNLGAAHKWETASDPKITGIVISVTTCNYRLYVWRITKLAERFSVCKSF